MTSTAKMFRLSAVAFAALVTLLATGCGPSSSSVQEVSINVTPEDQKVVYVDIFINLTGNADFNLLEESIPEMLITSLDGIRSVKIIPRDKMQKYLVARSEQHDTASLPVTARSLGAHYMIDGWIDRNQEGKYRIYANLLNLESNKLRERFAAVDFDSKDQALEAANRLVTEIQDNLSVPREELEDAKAKYANNYDIHRQYLRAWQSYNRGRPEVAVALFEKAILMAEDAYKRDLEQGKAEESDVPPGIYYHFLAAQIYNELGNEQRARELFRPVYEHRESFSSHREIIGFIEAVWAELQGDYATAKKLYGKVKDFRRFGSEYYLRLAHIALKEGKDPKYAIAFVKQGIEKYPGEDLLRKRYAELEYLIEGEKAVERYTGKAAEKNDDPISVEVASTMVNEKMLGDSLKKLTLTLPTVTIVRAPEGVEADLSGTTAFSMRVGDVDIKFDINELKKACDVTCEESLEGVALLGILAAQKGKTEIALEIAGLVSAGVTVPRAVDDGYRIHSVIAMSAGDYAEAEKYARKISIHNPNRFITLGNIYLRVGEPEKAAQIMEKALKIGKKISPLIYYYVANANLLAGNYEKWDRYTRLFLKETTELNRLARQAGRNVEQ